MGYWIHIDDLPVGGGGGGDKPGCLGCLGCIGILAGVFGVWYVLRYVKENIMTVLAFALVLGSLAALAGIIYMLKETGFEKGAVLAGIVGFAAGAIFTNKILGIFGVVTSAIGGHISMGLILAAVVMFIYILVT